MKLAAHSLSQKLILLDDNAIDDIYGKIHGAKMDSSGWMLPTNSRPDNISFAVGDHYFTISGEDLKFAPSNNGMSFGAIQSRGQNKQDIFGDVSTAAWIVQRVVG